MALLNIFMKLHTIVWNTCGYVSVKLAYILFGESLHMLLKNLQGYQFFWDTVYILASGMSAPMHGVNH